MAAVPGSSVIVTNPTRYAVALRYAHGDMAAPVVVAKGVDTIALKIREIATQAGVPIVEPSLARPLFASVPQERHAQSVSARRGFGQERCAPEEGILMMKFLANTKIPTKILSILAMLGVVCLGVSFYGSRCRRQKCRRVLLPVSVPIVLCELDQSTQLDLFQNLGQLRIVRAIDALRPRGELLQLCCTWLAPFDLRLKPFKRSKTLFGLRRHPAPALRFPLGRQNHQHVDRCRGLSRSGCSLRCRGRTSRRESAALCPEGSQVPQ